MAKRAEIVGMKELERTFKQLSRVPQTVVTKAARAGAMIALKATRENAPVDTGQLRKGIILKGERRVKIGKKVYDVMMDPAMNDEFVKMSGMLGNKRAYYPASMEYGFLTVDGGYVPGYHFMRRGLTENKSAIENKMVEIAGKAIDNILKKGR